MPLAELFRTAKDKFTETMDAGSRLAEGMSTRARRLKQAMFSDEVEPSPEKNRPATTPKRWEQPSTAGEQNYQESEVKRARRSRR